MSQRQLFQSASLFEPAVFDAIREALNLAPGRELNASMRFSQLTQSEIDWCVLYESLLALAEPVGELDSDEWSVLGGNPGFQRGRLPRNPLSDVVTFFASRVAATPKNVALVCAAAKLLKHHLSGNRPAGRNVLELRRTEWPKLYRELNQVFQTPAIELSSERWERLWAEKNGTASVNCAITDGDVLRLIEECCDAVK